MASENMPESERLEREQVRAGIGDMGKRAEEI